MIGEEWKLLEPGQNVSSRCPATYYDFVLVENKFVCRDCDEERDAVPCDTYGCKAPKSEGATFCLTCYFDYLEDRDAYK